MEKREDAGVNKTTTKKPVNFCYCGKRVISKWGFYLCEDHFNDTQPKEKKQRRGKYSGFSKKFKGAYERD